MKAKLFLLSFGCIALANGLVNFSELSNQQAIDVISKARYTNDKKYKRKIDLKERMLAASNEVDQKLKTKILAEEPVLSIIIPCYNRQDTVGKAIDSIYSQNLTVPFEVICVDDCSKDNTLKVLLEYESKYHNFFVYQHLENKRSPAARNTAILHARGSLIFNLDSDDYLSNGCLQSLLNLQNKENADTVSFGQAAVFYDFKYEQFSIKIMHTFHDIKYTNYKLNDYKDIDWLGSVICKLFTKKSWLDVGGFLEERGHDALSFGLSQTCRGIKWSISDKDFYHHRVWSNNSSMYNVDTRDNVMFLAPVLILEEYAELFNKTPIYSNLNTHTKLENFLRSSMTHWTKQLIKGIKNEDSGNFAEAINCYEDALKKGCDHINLYLALMHMYAYENQIEKLEIMAKAVREKFRLFLD